MFNKNHNTGTLLPVNNTSNVGVINASNVVQIKAPVKKQTFLSAFEDQKVQKYEVYKSSDDVLALSVCWKRLRDTKGVYNQISSLVDRELFDHVTAEDRERANLIRDYYSKKIMMLKLQGNELTNFRNDLNEFIHGDGRTFKESDMPLVFRLPEFYNYDTEFNSVFSGYNKKFNNRTQDYEQKVKTLTPIKTFTVKRKFQHKIEYWFSDENNYLVLMVVEHLNPLLSLLNHQFKNESVTIRGVFLKKIRDDCEYFRVDKYQFVFDN